MSDVNTPAALSRADREAMLSGVDKLVAKLVRTCGLPQAEWEDAEQDIKLLLWQITESFDPGRGVKWSTYAAAAAKRQLANMTAAYLSGRGTEVHLEADDWNALPATGQDVEPDTEGQLHRAVQRQLAGGLLDAIAPEATPTRELVELVALGGMSVRQVALQKGHPVQSTRTNLKLGIRKLQRKGLTQHVASDAEVDAILVPDPARAEKSREGRRRARARAAGGEGQEQSVPAQPPSPAEAEPCPAALSI